jgi:hypothetical protein
VIDNTPRETLRAVSGDLLASPVIKPLAGIKPKGVAGATLSGDGSVVLLLDIDELLDAKSGGSPVALSRRLCSANQSDPEAQSRAEWLRGFHRPPPDTRPRQRRQRAGQVR